MTQLSPDEVARLSARERLDLIGQLWDSLTDDDLPLTPAQRSELERRLETFDRDQGESVTWAELKAELSARRR